ncbi:MAG TPA: DNA starvation/stationary phase protection protein [Chryseolinea sp.]|nr:DNA starvation/stationary phase protection protein [Chryseolinea sp.]
MTKSQNTKKIEDVELENVPQTQLDNRMAKAKPTKLGWTSEEIQNVCTALNQLLANYSVHYQKLRNYHWNVKGSDFFDLHEQFEMQYTEALKNIDDIAERIRIFQETPLSTMKEYLEASEIKETTSSLTSDLMVREILSDYRILLEHMFAVVEIAAEQNDSGTEEMIKVFIHNLEKHHWMLSAFLAK